MSRRISLLAVGHATSVFLSLSFALCVAWDLILPDMAMYRTWQALLPGFEWLSWRSFLLGVVEAYGYGWYFALVWVPLYNYFVARNSQNRGDEWHGMRSDHHYG